MSDALKASPVVLIVDDELMQRMPMKKTLTKAGFRVEEAGDGRQGVERFQKLRPDIVLMDVMMPEMDGFLACETIRSFPEARHTPILMVTGLDDVHSIHRAFQVGATDFITKPISWPLLPHRVRYMLRSSQTTMALANKEMELIQTRLEIIRRLGIAAEFRDNETGNHIIRMSKYAAIIARESGLGPDECDLILHAAPMHDIGKIGTPDNILLKPGKLTDEEFAVMQQHAVIGGEMLSGNPAELMKAAHIIALTHHEKWNGRGYPIGLKGEEIPLYGRICSIADVFDALTSNRPYKKAWTIEDAVAEIKKSAGSQFDPQLVSCFERTLPEILKIKEMYEDDDQDQEALSARQAGR